MRQNRSSFWLLPAIELLQEESYNDNQKLEYNIIPLEDARRDQWQEMYGVNDQTLTAMQKSYDRTMALVGEGINASNEYLSLQKQARDANYLAMVQPGYVAPASGCRCAG